MKHTLCDGPLTIFPIKLTAVHGKLMAAGHCAVGFIVNCGEVSELLVQGVLKRDYDRCSWKRKRLVVDMSNSRSIA